ncbi:MAG: hypothetical protein SH848_16835 [Saprospiraceae bacterium]|nr:hypothetical protein [Saprospiraceae bacterium]
MKFFVTNFKWIMLLSGLLTCTMFLGLISPQAQMMSNFGTSIEGPLAEIIVRNWSALIGLTGIMLIYGAFVPAVRRYSLVIAGTGKVIFIFLLLSWGKPYLEFGAGTAVVADSLMIVLFAIYLFFFRSSNPA